MKQYISLFNSFFIIGVFLISLISYSILSRQKLIFLNSFNISSTNVDLLILSFSSLMLILYSLLLSLAKTISGNFNKESNWLNLVLEIYLNHKPNLKNNLKIY